MAIKVNTDTHRNNIIVHVEQTTANIDVETNQSGISDIETKPLFGPQGEKGEQGEQGIQGIQGEKGDTGNGIVNIVKTSTIDNVDIYTVNYTNGGSDEFTVTNAPSTYIHEQAIASDEWVIEHNLNKYPYPICVDSAGSVFEPAYEYPIVEGELSKNTIILKMNGATTGKAFLN